MIWLALLTVLATWVVIFRTPVGLRIRSVGEHPRAADTVGINVYLIRYAAVILSGGLAAAGGAYLSIGFVNSFNENMTFGRGFIALAALIFGNWRPFSAAAALHAVRVLQRARATAAGVLRLRSGPVPGAPVRSHVDRGRRRGRPLDPSRSRWPSLQEAVTRAL